LCVERSDRSGNQQHPRSPSQRHEQDEHDGPDERARDHRARARRRDRRTQQDEHRRRRDALHIRPRLPPRPQRQRHREREQHRVRVGIGAEARVARALRRRRRHDRLSVVDREDNRAAERERDRAEEDGEQEWAHPVRAARGSPRDCTCGDEQRRQRQRAARGQVRIRRPRRGEEREREEGDPGHEQHGYADPPTRRGVQKREHRELRERVPADVAPDRDVERIRVAYGEARPEDERRDEELRAALQLQPETRHGT
jgi:hypothetical protein